MQSYSDLVQVLNETAFCNLNFQRTGDFKFCVHGVPPPFHKGKPYIGDRRGASSKAVAHENADILASSEVVAPDSAGKLVLFGATVTFDSAEVSVVVFVAVVVVFLG